MKNISVKISVPGLSDIRQNAEEIEETAKQLRRAIGELEEKLYRNGLAIDAVIEGASPKDEIIVSREN